MVILVPHQANIVRNNTSVTAGVAMETCLTPELPGDDASSLGDVVTVNVGGTRYEITQRTIDRLPSSRIAKLDKQSLHYRKDRDEYYFDRDSEMFGHVLNYCRTGRLHVPRDSCSTHVKHELDYWGVPDTHIAECCWLQYQSQWDQMETLARFDHSTFQKPMEFTGGVTWWQRFRARGWSVMDDPGSSTLAKVFSVVSVTWVLLSLTVFVLETHPYFREEMTAQDYAEYWDVSLDELLDGWQGDRPPGAPPDSDMYDLPHSNGAERVQPQQQPLQQPQQQPQQQQQQQQLPQQQDNNGPANGEEIVTRKKRLAGLFSEEERVKLVNLLNFAHVELSERSGHEAEGIGSRVVTDQSHRRVRRSTEEGNSTTNATNATTYSINSDLGAVNPVLLALDKACAVYFTLELILRFILCPRVYLFFTSVLNIVDFVSIVPFYLTFAVHYFFPETKYEETMWLELLMILRTTRVFRMFRLMKHNRGLQVLLYTLRASCREMLLMVLFLLIGMLMYASLIYLTNHNDEHFISIPHSFWWAIVTMTTVGYGDTYPTTNSGYFVGSLCAVSGVLMVAFTVPIMVNNFILFYQHVQYRKDGNTSAESLAAQRKFSNKVSDVASDVYYINKLNRSPSYSDSDLGVTEFNGKLSDEK